MKKFKPIEIEGVGLKGRIKRRKKPVKTKNIETQTYVYQNGIISFPNPISFYLKQLEDIIKQCKKAKKNETMVRIIIPLLKGLKLGKPKKRKGK